MYYKWDVENKVAPTKTVGKFEIWFFLQGASAASHAASVKTADVSYMHKVSFGISAGTRQAVMRHF